MLLYIVAGAILQILLQTSGKSQLLYTTRDNCIDSGGLQKIINWKKANRFPVRPVPCSPTQ
jgi:hypothetical protein